MSVVRPAGIARIPTQSTMRSVKLADVLILGLAFAVSLVFWASTVYLWANYLFFHTIIELVSVVVGFMVFGIAWHARAFGERPFFLVLGVGLLGVGVIDLIHTVTYSGLGIFPEGGINLPTQLWVAGRYLESLVFVTAVSLLPRERPIRAWGALGLALTATALLMLSIEPWDIFPDALLETSGMTPFKIASEYIVAGLFLLAGLLMWRHRTHLDTRIRRLLLAALGLKVVAEVAFTLYGIDVYGTLNALGHIIKATATIAVYLALVQASLVTPYRTLFRDLLESREALSKVNETLEQRVRTRTAELEASNQELEAFSYTVAHDLRSPLRAQAGFSRQLLQHYGSQLDARGKDYLARINQAALRMGRLIDDLLAMAQVTRKRLTIEDVDLSELAQEIVADLKQKEPDRLVNVDIAPGMMASGDRDLLALALFQLLDNAWKFTRERLPAEIGFGLTHVNGLAACFVKDNGVGFDTTYADKLFRPFHRLDLGDQYGGTGMGLALVQRIIARHGGRVWAESQPGQGATFYFTLREQT